MPQTCKYYTHILLACSQIVSGPRSWQCGLWFMVLSTDLYMLVSSFRIIQGVCAGEVSVAKFGYDIMPSWLL